jgi:hypothetical protein
VFGVSPSLAYALVVSGSVVWAALAIFYSYRTSQLKSFQRHLPSASCSSLSLWTSSARSPHGLSLNTPELRLPSELPFIRLVVQSATGARIAYTRQRLHDFKSTQVHNLSSRLLCCVVPPGYRRLLVISKRSPTNASTTASIRIDCRVWSSITAGNSLPLCDI